MKSLRASVVVGWSSFVAASIVVGAEADRAGSGAAVTGTGTLFADEVVARGKGFEIKRSQLEEAYILFKANAASRGQQIQEPPERIEQQLLDRMVTVEVLKAKSTPEDRSKATNRADKVAAEVQAKSGTPGNWERQLKAAGITPERFKAELLERATVEEVMEREVKAFVVITTEQAKKFYEENSERFLAPETVRIRHILIATQDNNTGQAYTESQKVAAREKADKVHARAKAGEDFTKLVKEVSDDILSREKEGEYKFPRGGMVPEVEAASFSLQTNQISDVVTSPYGFHLVQLLEKTAPQKIDFAKVEERIKEGLMMMELEKQMPSYLQRVKTEAGVELLLNKSSK